MPGKRYRYRIKTGPWKGRRARIVGQGSIKDHLLVEIKGVTLPDHGLASVNYRWLQEIPQKSTRRKRGRHARR
jgi:hypothetical protein